MIPFDIQTAEYSVCRLEGLSLSEALRLWKAKFETIKHFKKEVIRHSALERLGEFVADMWDNIEPVTVQGALQEKNMEKRRVMFDCIGVSRLFKELEPNLLDRQVLNKVRTRWNENNEPYEHQFEDTYELYRLDGNKLFTVKERWSEPNPVYAVRCRCTTTNREYWIYVPEQAALGGRMSSADVKPDAVRSIAWTIRLNISKPKRIFRQGDIIIAEESDESEEVPFYHLSKEDYLFLMFSET